MKNFDFKQAAMTMAITMATLIVYDKFVAPMIDKNVG